MNHHSLQEQSFANLEQLRAYHDERFIHLAYRAIMNREAEAEVLDYYLSQFRQNLSRTEFLLALRASPETPYRYQGNKTHPLEDIASKPTIKDDMISSQHQQLPNGLRELTPLARNIYFQLKSALAIHSTGRMA
ncbi:DUF4214 domain-containing protein [Nitrosomonas communis]|uniref:DUF4214 domain-containing protein n=1 Tax=Nitrosomonas communis TaxID=44574 RepID=A0A1H2Q8Y5_9PROT|nr:DUF4214 domain-containing protein [Nitrosomonas communis]SDW03707.1 protein of unknown function [Nitrosomonas communis]